jgi:ADP-heptose:LPS heptosyltransferase
MESMKQTMEMGGRVRRLLIFRLGSIGDTVVALPAFKLIARAFAGAERRVLTNFPVTRDAAPLQSVLGDGGLVDGYFAYPGGTRSPAEILALRRRIAGWNPDLAIYLNEPRSLAATVRDFLFLKACGVGCVIGLPLRPDLRHYRTRVEFGLWESETMRLARCISEIGDVDVSDPSNWGLAFTPAEEEEALSALAGWPAAGRFVAFGIGAKIDFKNWGTENWRRVLDALSERHPDLGLVLVGAAGDTSAAARAAAGWTGPILDLCGRTPPRISALVIKRAGLYMGHDSGPMHLAASVGTPSVIVFSTHVRPGVWLPSGNAFRVFYPGLSWSGGDPPVMRDAAGETNITLIPPDQVIAACEDRLGDHEDLRAAQ